MSWQAVVSMQSMKKEKSFNILIYIFGPVVRYIIVSEVVTAAMELLRQRYLEDMLLQGADAAYSHTMLTVWSFLTILLSAAAGCLSVRRDAQWEWHAFITAQKQRSSLAAQAKKTARTGQSAKADGNARTGQTAQVSGSERTGQSAGSSGVFAWSWIYGASDERLRGRVMALLLTAAVFSALGINVLFSCIMPGALSQQIAGGLPGPAGILLQALLYGFIMPFAEETVFRGIFYPRLQRYYGTGAAILASALFFGIYHGALLQGVYAFIMGLLFAAAYEASGRFTVPCALHGACNLVILLLQWTDTYSAVCRPVWAVVFPGIAACAFLTIYMLIKKTAE